MRLDYTPNAPSAVLSLCSAQSVVHTAAQSTMHNPQSTIHSPQSTHSLRAACSALCPNSCSSDGSSFPPLSRPNEASPSGATARTQTSGGATGATPLERLEGGPQQWSLGCKRGALVCGKMRTTVSIVAQRATSSADETRSQLTSTRAPAFPVFLSHSECQFVGK